MVSGKKSVAEKIVYGALDRIKERGAADPVEVFDAALEAVKTVDECLHKIVPAILAKGGTVAITADHGNCEIMMDPSTGGPHTAHTTNLVPVAVVGAPDGTTLVDGRLADLAPTLLDLMQLDVPPEMTGKSLLQ